MRSKSPLGLSKFWCLVILGRWRNRQHKKQDVFYRWFYCTLWMITYLRSVSWNYINFGVNRYTLNPFLSYFLPTEPRAAGCVCSTNPAWQQPCTKYQVSKPQLVLTESSSDGLLGFLECKAVSLIAMNSNLLLWLFLHLLQSYLNNTFTSCLT